MSVINKTKCDGPGCKNIADHDLWDAPTFHCLKMGGSDFEMSFGANLIFDFCCMGCLEKWLKEQRDDSE